MVIPLTDAAKALGIHKDTLAHRIGSRGLNMVDAILLEGHNLARFKQENSLKLAAKTLWVLSRSGYEKLRNQ